MIYVDNAATTKMSDEVLDVVCNLLRNEYGNPSSLHTIGQNAKSYLENARLTIANQINASPKEIYFTSGGSEADNQAIISAAMKGEQNGKNHIISTKFEHHAVLHTLDYLKKNGFDITLLDVNENGVVKPSQVEDAITDKTCLVTIMMANNEIGTIQPIKEITEICSKHRILFHTDAVQAIGHIPVDVKELNVNYLSASAHKFHGPKGVGFLYVKAGSPLSAIINGGAQERGKRAGTENLASIVGMAIALENAVKSLDSNMKYVKSLYNRLYDGLHTIERCRINGDLEQRLPGTLNICFEGIEGESLLLLLDAKGICASSGSACTSGSLEPSHVLLSIGVPVEVAHGSLRLSLCEYNTMEEMNYIVNELPKIVDYLRSISPVWEKIMKGERVE